MLQRLNCSASRPRRHAVRALCVALLCCFTLSGCGDMLKISLDASPRPSAGYTPEEQAMVSQWLKGLVGKSAAEQGTFAAAVWRDPAAHRALRDRAVYLTAARPGQYAVQARQELSRLYAGDVFNRARMEHLYLADLHTADDATLKEALPSVPHMQEQTFPWSMLLWESAQRRLLADNASVLTRLSAAGIFADPAALGIGAAPVLTKPGAGRVAMLLPLSGTASSLGRQIEAGARAAVKKLEASGTVMELVVIDTNQPDWLSRYAALPPDCVTVGGPLLPSPYKALRAQGFGGRAVFAFLSQLPDAADEGRVAWRFFTSQEDQIDAVLAFASQELGIHDFGILSPDDAYGRRMSALFAAAAGRQHCAVQSATYPLGNVKAWTRLTGEFTQARYVARGAMPKANARFDAVFLPDTWNSVDMMVSLLRYHGAYDRVVLGTVLWEDGLKKSHARDAEVFGLSLFPAAWDENSESPANVAFKQAMSKSDEEAGGWSVLGYDFVHFAAALGLHEPVKSATALTPVLNKAPAMEWAGAPVVWDALGLAHRQLFLFQPARLGVVPLDRKAFDAYYRKMNQLPGASRRAPLPNLLPDQEKDETEDAAPQPAGNGASAASF